MSQPDVRTGPHRRGRLPWVCALILAGWGGLGLAGAGGVEVGAARVDVTPAVPIRLTGYGNRTTNSIGVQQKLWAKALAIGSDAEGPAIFVTLDNCGIAEETYLEVRRRLHDRAGLPPERLVIACSHTHSGPCTTGWAPNIFAADISPADQEVIDRYTAGLVRQLEQVAMAALTARRRGELFRTEGRVGFARNRRVVTGQAARFGENPAGPVDDSLPLLAARDASGALVAVLANYACHCTTLEGAFNQVCGDWAGFAQESIERHHPGVVAMVSIGCGADANPAPRGGADGGLAYARQNGEALGAEVSRLLGRTLRPLQDPLRARLQAVQLPFGKPFSRAELQERSLRAGIVGHHARKWLGRLDRGETVPTALSYYIQTWNFGEDLAMIFLSGEVVVDYALRLRQELDPARLWISAYANYVPCYIPSRRILAEGGYEAEDSLWYYDRPGRLSTQIEDQIIRTVHELLPPAFALDPRKAELPDPLEPRQALARFDLAADLGIDLVASEPLVESPVAIDWGADGRLWVCEMYDYPSGLGGDHGPGGRIKVLSSSRGDGVYDRAVLFLDHVSFPTGVTPWARGALICAAPNILYAEDTDGDGRADVVRTNFTGFATHNFQARVNGFSWGLDGWLHGSSGLFGGKVTSLKLGTTVDLSGRDFRVRPETGEIEPLAGISQMGRVRDDFDHWFGNDNSTLLWHYPIPERSLRHNPAAHVSETRALVPRGQDPNRLFPTSHTLERFNDPGSANRTTSACGPGIYRDALLPYSGDAFICEPVHNLVTHLALHQDGGQVTGERPAAEQSAEFLASSDNWFRPVQVRTGPDGGLWVVDMYRFVIEHPRWIPPDRLARLDPRAGADRGRIYRISRRGVPLRKIPDLSRLGPGELAAHLQSTNGVVRDLAQQKLLAHPVADWSGPVEQLAREGWPATRVQALATLALGQALQEPTLVRGLQDPHPRVREQALRCLEGMPGWERGEAIATHGPAALQLGLLSVDPDRSVRQQLALTLAGAPAGQFDELMGALARQSAADPRLRTAVLTGAPRHGPAMLRHLVAASEVDPAHLDLAREIVGSAPGIGSPSQGELAATLRVMDGNALWRFGLLESWLGNVYQGANPADAAVLKAGAEAARLELRNEAGPPAVRSAAARFLGALADGLSAADLEALVGLLRPGSSAELQSAGLEALKRHKGPEPGRLLLSGWPSLTPAERTARIGLLVTRAEWASLLLNQAEQGTVAVAEIPLLQRQKLMTHPDSGLGERARRVLAGTVSADRVALVMRYRGTLPLRGVAARGVQAFEANCAPCHALRGHGQPVGPNLAEFTGKSDEDFLVAILNPNAAINPNYLGYEVQLRDGRALTGVVRDETAGGLTLVQAGGGKEHLLRSDVQEMRASRVSLMPEGLEQAIPPEAMADLIAWVRQAAPEGFGSASADQAAAARREFAAGGPPSVAKITQSLEPLRYPSWLGLLRLAYCRQDGSTLEFVTPPLPPGRPGEPARLRLAAAMGFLSQPSGGFSLAVDGRTVLEFNVSLADRTWQSPDGTVRMQYQVKERNGEDSNGILTLELSPTLVKPGQPVEIRVQGSRSQSQRWFGVYEGF